MGRKRRKIVTRIVAILLLLGIVMTSAGFDNLASAANENTSAEIKEDEIASGDEEGSDLDDSLNSNDATVEEDQIDGNDETISSDGKSESNTDIGESEPDTDVQNSNNVKAGENGIRTVNNSPVVLSSDYPQKFEIYGQQYIGAGGEGIPDNLHVRFLIHQKDDGTFQMEQTFASDYQIHSTVSGSYTIYVIPKEEFPDGKIQNIYTVNKTALVTFNMSDVAKNIDFSKLTDYVFEEGDMLCFSPYVRGVPSFSFTGETLVPDGYREPPTHTGSDGDKRVNANYYLDESPENSIVALYEFTSAGIKEILNNPPQFNTFGSLYLQQGGVNKSESELIKMGVKATDDRDADGILPSENKTIDYTDKITYSFPSGGNGLDSSLFDVQQPSSWNVQYSVTDAWGSYSKASRNVFVFPDIESKKVTMDAFTYNDDGSIEINVKSGETLEESVSEYYVKFGDITNNYITKINTRSYASENSTDRLFEITYGSAEKTFWVTTNGDVYLPDFYISTRGVICAENVKSITVAEDRSVVIKTTFKNHAGEEVEVKVSSDGVVTYPIEMYIESFTFTDTELGEITIADTYNGDLTEYLQAGQVAELKFVIWNPVDVDAAYDVMQFKVEDFSIAGQWMDVISAKGQEEGSSAIADYEVPPIGQGELLQDGSWPTMVPNDSKKFTITAEVALPEDFSIDILDHSSGLPRVHMKAILEGTTATIDRYIAVASDPLVEGKNVFWSTKDMGTSLSANYAQNNMASARTYDDDTWHALEDVSTNNLKITSEAYKLYSFAESSWKESSKADFESLVDVQEGNPAIYSYGFTVKDTRREAMGYDVANPLEASETAYLYAANKVAASTDKSKVLMANGSVPVFTETKAATYSSEGDLINEVLKQVSFEAVQLDEINGTVTDLSVGTDVIAEIDGTPDYNHQNPLPGEYTLYVYFAGQDKTSGISIAFKIEENTWSYDTDDRTEVDGASGFIVIPKSISMERDPAYAADITTDKPVVAGKGEVYFADYPNATGVRYDVSIDDTITLKKEGDENSSFEAQSFGGTPAAEKKTSLGLIDNTMVEGEGLEVCYYSTEETPFTSKGKWTGTATFYFSRQ